MSQEKVSINDIGAAIADWKERRGPKEAKKPIPVDAPPIPTGTQAVDHYEIVEDGITKHTEHVWIAPPLIT